MTPLGDIVAIPLRGAWTGNRGILHEGREIVRCHASDLWITCALDFRGRRREARGTARVITPPSTVAVLRAGYPVQIAVRT